MSKQLHHSANGSTLSVCNRYLLLIATAIIFVQFKTTAQNISVNSTGALPDPSAMLDVVSANKGLLMPRVSLTGVNDNTTIPNPATSLVVYNTNSAMSGGGIGFWYWNGTQWARFSGALGSNRNYWVNRACWSRWLKWYKWNKWCNRKYRSQR
ncbi:MAG: hypothetical protein WAQ28_02995 [Bacteroidia bacterium]|jgi:hypothetical protein